MRYLPRDAPEDEEEAVVHIDAVVLRLEGAQPVIVILGDDLPHRLVVPGEGDAQPLGGLGEGVDVSLLY